MNSTSFDSADSSSESNNREDGSTFSAAPDSEIPSASDWIQVRIPLVEPTGETSLQTVEIPYEQYLALMAEPDRDSSSQGLVPKSQQIDQVAEGQSPAEISSDNSSSVQQILLTNLVQIPQILLQQPAIIIPSQGNVTNVGISTGDLETNVIADETLPVVTSPKKSQRTTRAYQLDAKRYVCSYPSCNKSYVKASHLTAHKRLHNGERPFACQAEDCSRSFTRRDELQRHQLTHTGVKNYACAFCGKRFLRRDHTLKHMKVHMSKSKKNVVDGAPDDGVM